MGITYHIDEIFEMAGQLEKNGAEFYQQAADSAKDPDVKNLLKGLAAMEVEHKNTFSKMRKELVETKDIESFYDPQGEAVLYLKALVDTRVFFERKIDVSSFEEVLKEAIIAEKESIVFYFGMKVMLSDDSGKSKIKAIIEEEMSHVRILGKKLMALKK